MADEDRDPGRAGDAGEASPDKALDAAGKAVDALRELSESTAPTPGLNDDAEAALDTARAVGAQAGAAIAPGEGEAFELPSFGSGGAAAPPRGLDLLSDVNLNVKIELGRTRMLVEDVLRLGEGAVVELDKLAGDPVDVFVNDRPIARGEILVLNDNFCIRINEIIGGPEEAASKD